jgi:signal transduction histidine kinase
MSITLTGCERMTLRRKLLLTFVALLMLVGAQAGIAVLLLSQVADGSAELVRPALARVDTVAHLESDVLRLHTLEHSLLDDGADVPDSQVRTEIDNLHQAVNALLQQYRSQPLDSGRAALLNKVDSEYQDLLSLQARIDELHAQGDHTQAVAEYYASEPSLLQLDDDIHRLRHLEYANIQDLRDRLVATTDGVKWPLLMTVAVVGLTELWLGYSLSRGIVRSLRQLQDGARRIARESLGERIPPPPEPEFADLAETLNDVMVTLAKTRAERSRLEAERVTLLREHLAQVVQAQEDERARVSRELHDQSGQVLTALKYGLNHLARVCPEEAVRTEIGDLLELATAAGRQISALARDLRPAVLDDLGLVAALRGYCREYTEHVGVPVEIAASPTLARLGPLTETTTFRVIQEALTNVAKHAGARHVWIELSQSSDNVLIRVRDDGRGFAPESVSSGLGLTGMRERVALIGGELRIDSQPGAGTLISLTVPAVAAAPQREALVV